MIRQSFSRWIFLIITLLQYYHSCLTNSFTILTRCPNYHVKAWSFISPSSSSPSNDFGLSSAVIRMKKEHEDDDNNGNERNSNENDDPNVNLYIHELEMNLSKCQALSLEQKEEIGMLRDELRAIGLQFSQERQLRSEEARKLSKVREELTRQLIANQRSASLEQSQLRQEMDTKIEVRNNAVTDLQNKVFQLEQQLFQFEMERQNVKSVLKLLVQSSRTKLVQWAKQSWSRIWSFKKRRSKTRRSDKL